MKTATSKEFGARLVLLLVLVLVAFPPPGYTNSTDPKSAVEPVLQTQQETWNRHGLDAFMAGDWNSPDLTFFSDAKETSGWLRSPCPSQRNYLP